MDPDDLPLHDLLGVGDDAAPGPDPLRAIVARAGRRRRRVAVGGAVVALVVGGALGYGLSNHSSSPAETSTASSPAVSGSGSGGSLAAGAANSGAGNSGAGNSGAGHSGAAGRVSGPLPIATNGILTHLFTRTTAGGVTLRVFRTALVSPGALPSGCVVDLPRVQVEVSTAAMVGITVGSAPATHSQPLTAVESDIVGQPEGDSTSVIMVATGPTVAQVRASFKGGATDSMTPAGGWAVLAGSVPAGLNAGAALGTITATDAAGRVVTSLPVTPTTFEPSGLTVPSCAFNCPTISTNAGAASSGASPPDACVPSPCGGALPPAPGSSGQGTPAPVTMPAVRAGGALACATPAPGAAAGGSTSSGHPSSGTSSASSTGAAR